jgi:hypothetical protein
MKTFFKLGLLALIAVIAVTAAVVRSAGLGPIERWRTAETDCPAFVDQAFADMVTNWVSQQLTKRASPRLLAEGSPERFAVVFQRFKRLGRLVHYDGATGSVIGSSALEIIIGGPGSRAHYDGSATFTNGQGTFHMDLVRGDDRWLIDSFTLDGVPPPSRVVGGPGVKRL